MAEIQDRLDAAFALHPVSTTLGDFRADAQLVRDETDALQSARKIVTSHSAVTRLFGERAKRLDWKLPQDGATGVRRGSGRRVLFAASTLGRKGCYELRDAIGGLDIELSLGGPILEEKEFWAGTRVVPMDGAIDVSRTSGFR